MIRNCILIVTKSEILAGDASQIKGIFDAIAEDSADLAFAQNGFDLIIHGYDDDPRGLAEIPEVREWFKKSVQDGIPWFYFLRLGDSENLRLLVTSLGYVSSSKNGDRTNYVVDDKKVVEYIKKCAETLFEFGNEHHIAEIVMYNLFLELKDALAFRNCN